MARYSPSLPELRRAVEAVLGEFLSERRRAVSEAAGLIDEIDRLVGAGGKRLRPAFCYWGHRACGGEHGPVIVTAAASLELLHTFAIVHDDIMDESDERRGEPSVHVRHGVGFALLAGDLALVLADELFLNAGFTPEIAMKAFAPYSLMRQEVIAGQHLDVRAGQLRDITEEESRRIAVLKSGRYSIEKPLVIGAVLANASNAIVRRLSAFGDPLGEAFQLRDDLLGTFGERASTGKPVDSDIREGKRNHLFAATARLLNGRDHDFFVDRWGGPGLSVEEIARLRSLVETSGARALTQKLVEDRTDAALAVLDTLPILPGASHALAELARDATHREL
jgi:geranylgeranyl diphosphate synthase type I